MEFSAFFNSLKIEYFYSESAENLLQRYKDCCKDENDFIQLYELKDILSVENIFNKLHKAYLSCEYRDFNNLFKEIERLSNVLEENSISCYSYSYFFYVYLVYIYNYDKYAASNSKGMDILEIPEKMEWNNPKTFDYSKLGSTTFGVDTQNSDGLTKAFPDYKKFYCEGNKLVSYKGTKSYVVVPDTISIVGKNAFSGNKKIKMVIIPDSVIAIEDGAFSNCDGLNLVHLGKKIKIIPNNCFKKCKNLKYIIGDNITEVGDGAFELCVQLKEINLDNLSITGTKSFYGCVSLSNYDFVSNLTVIGDYAFTNSKIESLFLNDVEYLGKNSFAGCSLLKDLVINNDILCVGETPFFGCSSLNSIDLRSNVSFRLFDLFAISDEEYNSCSYSFDTIKLFNLTPYICFNMTNIKSVIVNGDSNIISDGCFLNCISLENITFKNNEITEIGDYSFSGCNSLKSLNVIYLGNKIGNYAFYKCSSIEDFSFLNNVINFGDKCLAYTNLTKFDFLNKTFKYIGNFAFANSYYPDDININLNDTIVSAGAFHGISNINCLEIRNCSFDKKLLFALFERTREEFLEKVSIESLITDFEAEESLFAGFDSTYIECEISNGYVPEGLFSNCNNLYSVNLIGNVDTFGDSCFYDCSNLEYIEFNPDNELVICSHAFRNCNNYSFPYLERAKIIDDYAFYGSGLSKIKLTNNVEYIGSNAFGDCNIGSTIELPFVGNSLDSDAPFGIIFSEKLVSNSEVQIVGENKYYVPKNIKNVIITGDKISSCAFQNCYFINRVELPNIVTVNQPIFQNCTALKYLSFGPYLKEFNGVSLLGVDNIDEIIIDINDSFMAQSNSIFSKDHRTAYFMFDSRIDEEIKVFKSYSVLRYKNENLSLSDVEKIEQFAFDISTCSSINLVNCDAINSDAFFNCDNLKQISIKCDVYNSYNEIFKIKGNDIKLDSFTIENISLDSIKSLFRCIDSMVVKNLTLINCELFEDSFDGITIGELNIIGCSGNAKLNQNISKLTLENSDEISKLFIGSYKIENIFVSKDSIKKNEFDGINCNSLFLSNVIEIEESAFTNANISKLTIDGVLDIKFGAFSYNKIDTIIIQNSEYICEDNCVYKGDELIYYKSKNKKAKLPDSIRRIYKKSIDLINATSFELGENIYCDELSVFNSSSIERLICGENNLLMISKLFDDCDSIKEIVFKSNTIKKKYLSNFISVEKIILNSSIEQIGDFAFSNNEQLKVIENFEKAQIYGDFVLNGCKSIKRIEFNNNAIYIGYHIIQGCSSLSSISIPILEYSNEVDIVINDILGDFSDDLSINISKGDILDGMFSDIDNCICINYSPDFIGDSAFENVSNLTIDLTNTRSIGNDAFKNSNLTHKLNLKSCSQIGDNAFRGCANIKEINIESNVQNIGYNAFADISLEYLEISNSDKYKMIDNCLFENDDLIFYVPNSAQLKLSLSNEINEIRRNAFVNCRNLNYVSFDNCKKINSYSFIDCKALTEINLGSNEINISMLPFVNCDNVEKFTVFSITQGNVSKISDYFGNTNNSMNLKYLAITSSRVQKGEIDLGYSITDIVLNDNIIEIPDGYFANCYNLSRFNIPTRCKSIGDNAFNGCKYIDDLDLSDYNIEKIGAYAFANTGIKTAYFGDSIKSIGKSFLESTPIKILGFGNDISDFECDFYGINNDIEHICFRNVNFKSHAFENRDKLETIFVKNYTSEILPNACFSNCYKLKDLDIPSSYKRIGSNAFNNCVMLEKFIVQDDVYVETNAFAGCNNISLFEFNGKCELFSLKYFGFDKHQSKLSKVIVKNMSLTTGAFENFENIEEIEIKNRVKEVPYQCFKNCKRLRMLKLIGVKNIGDSAFENCHSIAEFNFSECITIELNAFKNCSSLRKIELPNTLKVLKNSFSGCNGINEIIFNNEIKNFKLSDYGFEKNNNYTITFDKVSFKESAFEDYTSLEKIYFISPIKSIPNRCFTGCLKLKLEDDFIGGLEKIGDCAFAGCQSLENVELNTVNIERYAFSGCIKLKEVKLGSMIKELPEGIFSHCSNLHDINMSNIQDIKSSVFENCSSLSRLDLKECVSIGENAFKNCKSISRIVIPSTVMNLGNCFTGCNNIKEFVFDNKLDNFKLSDYGISNKNFIDSIKFDSVKLSESAFENYPLIKKIEFKNLIANIPKKAFKNCSSLVFDDKFMPSLETIGDDAFRGCDLINDLHLINIKSIGDYAFADCNKLKTVVFGNNLKNIPEGLFANDTKLTDVQLSNGITTIDDFAFMNTSIESIRFNKSINYVGSMIFKDNDKKVTVEIPSKNIISTWEKDWNLGLKAKHKILKFMNPKVQIKIGG